MLISPTEARRLAGRPALVAAAVLTLAVIAAAATPQLLGARVAEALEGIGQANPGWLWLGALGFLCSLAGAAGAWRSAVGLCGGRMTLLDANARYGAGSIVNTFVPARVGDAVRIALFSRALGHRDRLWTMGGAFAAISAARGFVLTAFVVFGVAMGALPFWPLLVLGALVGLAVLVAWRSRNGRAQTHVAHVLDAFRALGREPRSGLRILGWVALATLGKIGAAAAVAAALGVGSPLMAAFLVVPALDLAGLLPLTPGNFGVTSGAVAMALQAHGAGWVQALSTGIAFHALETGVSLLYGVGGVLIVAGGSLTGTRRWLLVGVAATACTAVAAAFGATVLVDLV